MAIRFGNNGGNIMTGTSRFDLILARGGDDTVYGGAGTDLVFGGAGDDDLFGGAGTDLIFGGSGADLIDGGDDNDLLSGDRGNDALLGGGGNDALFGGAGSDTLDGGNGSDLLFGGSGIDWADYSGASTGGVHADLAAGTAISGADTDILRNIENLIGTNFADTLSGDNGDNVLLGNGGADLLYGGAGEDTLDGGDGNDTLDGGAGNDTLTGGLGTNLFKFGAADTGVDTVTDVKHGDTLDFTEFVTGGATLVLTETGTGDVEIGTDGGDLIAVLLDTAAVNLVVESDGTIDFVRQTIFGTGGGDLLNGGPGDESLNALFGDDTVFGGGGDDLIEGSVGNDVLYGGAGNDVLNGNIGDDTLNGGAGDDTLTGGSGTNLFEFGAADAGVDTVTDATPGDVLDFTEFVTAGATLVLTETGTGDVEIGTDGGDLIAVLLDTAAANLVVESDGTINVTRVDIIGSNGDDVLIGGPAAEFIDGGFGDDTLYGGGGDDILAGGDGSDNLTGGLGADVFVFGAADTGVDTVTDVYDGDSLDFTQFVTAGAALNLTETGDGDVEVSTDGGQLLAVLKNSGTVNLQVLPDGTIDFGFVGYIGSGANDHFVGTNGHESFSSGLGDDTVDGGRGNDTIDGGGGNDVLIGGLGNDVLIGGQGDDVLTGGPGDDVLTGGGGADRFDFNNLNEGVDTITDFTHGDDTLDIGNLLTSGDEVVLDGTVPGQVTVSVEGTDLAVVTSGISAADLANDIDFGGVAHTLTIV